MPPTPHLEPESRLFPGRPSSFLVMNRVAAQQYALDEPHVLISITSPGQDEVLLPDHASRRALLRIAFDDVGLEVEGLPLSVWWSPDRPPPVLFDDDHAAAIRTFVAEHRAGAEVVAVHCEAGLSRSPAVAMALSRWLNGDPGVAESLARWVTVERLGLDAGLRVWNLRVESVLERALAGA